MRKAAVFLLFVALVGAVYFRASTLTGGKGRPGGRGPGGRDAERVAVPVEVVAVHRGVIEDTVEITGEVQAWRTARVTPRIAGFMGEVRVRRGDVVSGGTTVIATMDDDELILEESRAFAALRVAEATFKEKQAAYADAVRSLERERSLFKDRVSSREALDATEYREKAAAAALQLAQAQVDRAQAELGLSSINRRHAKVVAPIDGVVSQRLLDGNEQVTPATVLVNLVDVDRIRVRGEITEADYWRLRPFKRSGIVITARITVGGAGQTFEGQVYALAPVFDSATRTATVEVDLPNPDRALLPGMFTRVALVLRRVEDAVLAPVEALCERDGQRGVFRLQDGTTARFIKPRFGIETRTSVQVLDGLAEGDSLVSTGNHLLTEGSRVTVVTPEMVVTAGTAVDGAKAQP